jgi:hypothetical protein
MIDSWISVLLNWTELATNCFWRRRVSPDGFQTSLRRHSPCHWSVMTDRTESQSCITVLLISKFEVTLRLTVSQYVLVSSTLVGLATRYYFLSVFCCLKFAVLSLWGALSDERMALHTVQLLSDPSRAEPVTILYCLIWDFPQPGGPGSHIYIP